MESEERAAWQKKVDEIESRRAMEIFDAQTDPAKLKKILARERDPHLPELIADKIRNGLEDPGGRGHDFWVPGEFEKAAREQDDIRAMMKAARRSATRSSESFSSSRLNRSRGPRPGRSRGTSRGSRPPRRRSTATEAASIATETSPGTDATRTTRSENEEGGGKRRSEARRTHARTRGGNPPGPPRTSAQHPTRTRPTTARGDIDARTGPPSTSRRRRNPPGLRSNSANGSRRRIDEPPPRRRPPTRGTSPLRLPNGSIARTPRWWPRRTPR